MNFLHWKICHYDWALQKMLELVEARINDTICDTIIFTEHFPVITLGRNKTANSLLVSKAFLQEQAIDVHEISRGGDITYHGPGQLVIYPIVKLEAGHRDIHHVMRLLEEIIIVSCQAFNVHLQTLDGLTGAWKIEKGTRNKKIASIGLGFKKWVSYHGIGINVSTNLKHFEYMNPCGLSNMNMENLEALTSQKIEMSKLIETLQINFKILEKYLNK